MRPTPLRGTKSPFRICVGLANFHLPKYPLRPEDAADLHCPHLVASLIPYPARPLSTWLVHAPAAPAAVPADGSADRAGRAFQSLPLPSRPPPACNSSACRCWTYSHGTHWPPSRACRRGYPTTSCSTRWGTAPYRLSAWRTAAPTPASSRSRNSPRPTSSLRPATSPTFSRSATSCRASPAPVLFSSPY